MRIVRASKADLAARVWTLMFDYLIRSSPERTEALGRRGLTPNDSRALFTLDTGWWTIEDGTSTYIVRRGRIVQQTTHGLIRFTGPPPD